MSRERGLDELELERVALMAEQALVIRLLNTPERGIHVMPSRDRDAIGHLDVAGYDVLILGEGHDERQAAGGEDGIEEHRGARLLG